MDTINSCIKILIIIFYLDSSWIINKIETHHHRWIVNNIKYKNNPKYETSWK